MTLIKGYNQRVHDWNMFAQDLNHHFICPYNDTSAHNDTPRCDSRPETNKWNCGCNTGEYTRFEVHSIIENSISDIVLCL
jgi:hypothetical protein